MSKVFDASDASLVCEMLEKIRDVLLIGLTSYGEIERLSDAEEKEKMCRNEIPDGLRVIHPTGTADTVSDFAEALSSVDTVMRLVRRRRQLPLEQHPARAP